MNNNIFYEYNEITDSNLKEYIQTNSKLHKYFKKDWNKLKAKQYCGILNYKGEDFYILPKIAKDNEVNLNIFVYMLMNAYDIKLHNEDIANAKNENSDSILEVFIQFFAKKLFQEFQKGIYKEYITEQNNLTALRGKYLIHENLKYNFTKTNIYCEYDEFSQNNELNCFFLYAVKTLLNFTKNKKLLKECELILDEVTFKVFDINALNINFNRLSMRYKNSFEFALLLLQKTIPTFEKDKKSFAFLFDMNDLFELFIGNIYKSIDFKTQTQYSQSFGNLLLQPDIMMDNLIIDTKYKKVETKKELNRDDKYQMFVYGTNFGIKNTMLLYPQHQNRVYENLDLGKDDKMIRLKMRSIDLDFNGGYDDYIKKISSKLERIK